MLHWGQELYPRAAVCFETEAQERFLSRVEGDESLNGLDDELELRRYHLLAAHECAWKGDEFIVRRNSTTRYYENHFANYRRASQGGAWEDGILIEFTNLSEQGVPSQDTEFVPVEDFLRSKRGSAATDTAQASTSARIRASVKSFLARLRF